MMWRAHIVAPDGSTEWRKIEAPDREAAVMRLVGEGAVPLDLRSGGQSLSELLQQPIHLSLGLPVTEQALILRQLATLVGSGVPVDRSLDLLAEQSSHRLARRTLSEMLTAVRGGTGLAAAFEAAGVFPAFVAGVVRAAEKGGRLSFALASIAERLELIASIRRQLITALSYPAAIFAATVGALLLVLMGVVPQFAPLFEGEEERLPLLTRGVLFLSNMVIEHSLLLMLLVATLSLLGIAAFKIDGVRATLERHRRWLPLMSLRDQYMAAQFASLLGTLLANGLKLVEALPLVRGALGSGIWDRFLRQVEHLIRAGHSLSAALATGDLVPSTVVRLIEVGERTGKLAENSLQAGKILSDAARARIDRMVALANPIAIISLGGLVGALVAGVMLGIFAMGDFAG